MKSARHHAPQRLLPSGEELIPNITYNTVRSLKQSSQEIQLEEPANNLLN